MSDVFSNSPGKDFVLKPFQELIRASSRAHLATPYFAEAHAVLAAAKAGKPIELRVGLNESTSLQALKAVLGVPNIAVRSLRDVFTQRSSFSMTISSSARQT